MKLIKFVIILTIWILITGCGGARISYDHFSEGYGHAPPIPRPGGQGPPGIGRVFDLPVDDFQIEGQLPELLELYRRKIIEMGHPLAEGVSQRYADAEVKNLQQRFAGNDKALRTELIRRLRPTVARPGTYEEFNNMRPYEAVDERSK
jgi:hypothetical protein